MAIEWRINSIPFPFPLPIQFNYKPPSNAIEWTIHANQINSISNWNGIKWSTQMNWMPSDWQVESIQFAIASNRNRNELQLIRHCNAQWEQMEYNCNRMELWLNAIANEWHVNWIDCQVHSNRMAIEWRISSVPLPIKSIPVLNRTQFNSMLHQMGIESVIDCIQNECQLQMEWAINGSINAGVANGIEWMNGINLQLELQLNWMSGQMNE
jgi:hypothetical protein